MKVALFYYQNDRFDAIFTMDASTVPISQKIFASSIIGVTSWTGHFAMIIKDKTS